MLLAALPVAVGDALTWFYFGVSCSISENASGWWEKLCRQNEPNVQIHFPGLAIVVLAACVVGARWRQSRGIFVGGLLCAIAAAAHLWIIYGDPAGNFDGLLT